MHVVTWLKWTYAHDDLVSLVFFACNLRLTSVSLATHGDKRDQLRWFPADVYSLQEAKKNAARAEILADPVVQAAIKCGIRPVVR